MEDAAPIVVVEETPIVVVDDAPVPPPIICEECASRELARKLQLAAEFQRGITTLCARLSPTLRDEDRRALIAELETIARCHADCCQK